jgi:hypothetical protein
MFHDQAVQPSSGFFLLNHKQRHARDGLIPPMSLFSAQPQRRDSLNFWTICRSQEEVS